MSIAIEDLVGSLSLNLVADNNGNVGIGTKSPSEKLHVNGKINIDGTLLSNESLVGLILYFAKDSVPDGWLKCNGAVISRTTYISLFNAIGTTFGDGDGEITFQLPDLRGEFIRGWDDGAGIDTGRIFGNSQGDSTKRPNNAFITTTDGLHSHTYNAPRLFRDVREWANYRVRKDLTSSNTGGAGSHIHTITGGGDPETRPRNISLIACIKY